MSISNLNNLGDKNNLDIQAHNITCNNLVCNGLDILNPTLDRLILSTTAGSAFTVTGMIFTVSNLNGVITLVCTQQFPTITTANSGSAFVQLLPPELRPPLTISIPMQGFVIDYTTSARLPVPMIATIAPSGLLTMSTLSGSALTAGTNTYGFYGCVFIYSLNTNL